MKEGLTMLKIADQLFSSKRTIETLRKNLMENLELKLSWCNLSSA
ncbi:MAG: LuxR C-terminal-related transcriptional regulator [Bacteroidota bacterium]|jgi:DNA-binding NarL/FixJ family response regulator